MDREIYIGENGLEKQIMQDLERTANPADGLMTVNELVGATLQKKQVWDKVQGSAMLLYREY